ncbi:MAG: Y-family DNA polymerase [Legionellales bacterium]
MFALIDCNNFYASCERLFRPDLREKPIVVLSSGDGCVIARSNEAKTLGIKMGEPYYKIKQFCDQNKVHIFSSNFTLYRDLSQRVMSIIEEAWEYTEIYSIDEAFLDLSSMNPVLHDVFCIDLQKLILKCTGIPVSIGIGASKTLAKVSNHIAKKELKIPFFNITNQSDWLKKIAVGDVWGIGQQWSKKLITQGIYTAYDLTQIDTAQLRKQYNIVMMQKAMELQGISCSAVHDDDEPRKSILSSRSFGKMQTEFDALFQSVSLHCANVYEKLREQKSLTYSVTVFLKTNRHRHDLAQYSPAASISFIAPTDDIRIITQHAKLCLEDIYKQGFYYKKAGVYLTELTDRAGYQQQDLFAKPSEKNIEKSQAFLKVFDKINKRFGKHSVRLASQGFDQSWDTQFQHKSPAYTTRWMELPLVK